MDPVFVYETSAHGCTSLLNPAGAFGDAPGLFWPAPAEAAGDAQLEYKYLALWVLQQIEDRVAGRLATPELLPEVPGPPTWDAAAAQWPLVV